MNPVGKGEGVETTRRHQDGIRYPFFCDSWSAVRLGNLRLEAPGQSGQTVEVCIDPSSQSSLPRNPEDPGNNHPLDPRSR